jgi:hypothetical protein
MCRTQRDILSQPSSNSVVSRLAADAVDATFHKDKTLAPALAVGGNDRAALPRRAITATVGQYHSIARWWWQGNNRNHCIRRLTIKTLCLKLDHGGSPQQRKIRIHAC